MFYFFSREFGWGIDEILHYDIFQLEIYSKSNISYNTKLNKKQKNFKSDYSNMSKDKVNIDSIKQLMSSNISGMNIKDKRKK